MGKACTKDLSSTRLEGSRIDTTGIESLEGSASRQPNVTAARSGTQAAAGQQTRSDASKVPPHSVLRGRAPDITRVYRFFVSMSGFKVRGLKTPKTSLSEKRSSFLSVNWDDFALEHKTQSVPKSANINWTDSFSFSWSVPSLNKLSERLVALSLYDDAQGLYGKFVGAVKIDLFTVATGTIHHDLKIQDLMNAEDDVGRLQVDIRMSQVCQLIINPVEVLVHIHERLDDLHALEDLGGHFPLSSSAPAVVEDRDRSSSDSDFDAEGRPKSGKEVVSSSIHAVEEGLAPYTAEWQLSMLPTGVDNPEHHYHFSSWTEMCDHPYWNVLDPLRVNHSSSPISSAQAAETADGSGNNLNPQSTTELSSHAQREISDGMPLLTASSASNAAPAAADGKARRRRRLRHSAVAGGAASPSVASRQRTPSSSWSVHGGVGGSTDADKRTSLHKPTSSDHGGSKTAGSAGGSTPRTTMPSVSERETDAHTLRHVPAAAAGGSTGALEASSPLASAAAVTEAEVVPKSSTAAQSSLSTIASSSNVALLGTNAKRGVNHIPAAAVQPASTLSSVPQYPLHDALLEVGGAPLRLNPVDADESVNPILDSGVASTSASIGSHRVSIIEPSSSHVAAPPPIGVTTANNRRRSSTAVRHVAVHTTGNTSVASSGGGSVGVSGGMTGGVPVEFGNAGGTHHEAASRQTSLLSLNRQDTYEKLASFCMKGQLCRDLLDHDLPTIQMETTSDHLRRNHLKLKLYARKGNLAPPRLYGEAWIPFTKVYNSDVVEERLQHFYDAPFNEKLWHEGKCIGYIEGLIVFQNNPLVRQIFAGVHTDEGFSRISPQILGGAEYKTSDSSSSSSPCDILPEEIRRVADLHKRYLDFLFRDTLHSPDELLIASSNAVTARAGTVRVNSSTTTTTTTNVFRRRMLLAAEQRQNGAALGLPTGGAGVNGAGPDEFKKNCEALLETLKSTHVDTGKAFLYSRTGGLLASQKTLLNLANHLLEYSDFVPWQFRGLHASILYHIMRRGELDIGSCLPRPPDSLRSLKPQEMRIIYDAAKYSIRQLETFKNSSTRTGDASSSEYRSAHPKVLLPSRSVNPEDEGEDVTGGERRLSAVGNSSERSSSVSSQSSNSEDHDRTIQLCNGLGISAEEGRALLLIASRLSDNDLRGVAQFHKRIKMCRQLDLTLRRMLNASLARLCSDVTFEAERKVLATYTAIAYFRLPEFRRTFLEVVLTSEERDAVIREWRGTDYLIDREALQKFQEWHTGTELRMVLDWSAFHSALNSYFTAEELEDQRKLIPAAPAEWPEKIALRGPFFFAFLEQFVKHVHHVAQSPENISWQNVPGYPSLLKALLLEMKSREVQKYPDCLLNSSGAMLVNTKLLSVFIKLLFLRTRLHHSPSVFSAINFLDYWLQVLTLRRQNLPSCFDFYFLRRGLDILLRADLCLNVAKSLWFLYKNLPIFTGRWLKTILVNLLIEDHSMNLMLSWSWLVRRCFIWFILYRVCESARRVIACLSPDSSKLDATLDEKITLLAYLEFVRRLEHIEIPNILILPISVSKLIDLITASSGGPPTSKDLTTATAIGNEAQSASGSGGANFLAEPAQLPVSPKESGRASRAIEGFKGVSKNRGARRPRIASSGESVLVAPRSPKVSSSYLPVSSMAIPKTGSANSVGSLSTLGPPQPSASSGGSPENDFGNGGGSGPSRVREDGGGAAVLPSWLVSDFWRSSLLRESPLPQLRENQKVYAKMFRLEFSKELSLYRQWVAGGATPLPMMHIPASPLDNNVDVPLDDEENQ